MEPSRTTPSIRLYAPRDRAAVRLVFAATADGGRPLPASFPDPEFAADLVTRYREYLTGTPGVRLLPLDATSAERAAELRATYGLRLPDAFQIAACLGAGATVFLGNDTRLRKVRELRIVLLSDIIFESEPPPKG